MSNFLPVTEPGPARGPLPAQMDGVLVLDKPSGPTSNRCLSALKRLGQKKIGHAGTLDPLASGVLLVLLGQGTKLSNYLLDGGLKVYRGTLRLGQETDTWDSEGRLVEERDWSGIGADAIGAAIAGWKGIQRQAVPPYSAAKHEGQPLYRLARSGRPVPEKVKEVEILQADILSMDLPLVSFRVSCSSGTYVRSLAHSLGMRLGCGAVLTELTREYSHPFGLDQAVPLDVLKARPEELARHVHPVRDALPGWPLVPVTSGEAARVRNGMALPCPGPLVGAIAANRGLALLVEEGRELALARLSDDHGLPTLAVARGLWR